MEILPNDSDAPFLARHGGAERHEESENGADGAFRTNALIGAADDANRRVIFPLTVREYRGTHREGLVRDILSIQDASHRTVSDVLFDRFPDVLRVMSPDVFAGYPAPPSGGCCVIS